MDLSLVKTGDVIEGMPVLVESTQIALTKSNKQFMRLTVRDKTKSVAAVMWDIREEDKNFKSGDVVNINALVDEFQGSLQLNIKSMTSSLQPASEFARNTAKNVDVLWSDILEIVGKFSEEFTKDVALEILSSPGMEKAFKKCPAALKIHNAWIGGLLEHTHAMCSLAKSILPHYKGYLPKLSEDKVMFGLIFHDIGKISEYDFSSPAFKLTGMGILINHLVIGPAIIHEAVNKLFAAKKYSLDELYRKERAHLMHLVAAHHGKQEWGSPVKPSTMEAILVHHIDKLDSDMMHAYEMVTSEEGDIPGFSEKSYTEGTRFLIP